MPRRVRPLCSSSFLGKLQCGHSRLASCWSLNEDQEGLIAICWNDIARMIPPLVRHSPLHRHDPVRAVSFRVPRSMDTSTEKAPLDASCNWEQGHRNAEQWHRAITEATFGARIAARVAHATSVNIKLFDTPSAFLALLRIQHEIHTLSRHSALPRPRLLRPPLSISTAKLRPQRVKGPTVSRGAAQIRFFVTLPQGDGASKWLGSGFHRKQGSTPHMLKLPAPPAHRARFMNPLSTVASCPQRQIRPPSRSGWSREIRQSEGERPCKV